MYLLCFTRIKPPSQRQLDIIGYNLHDNKSFGSLKKKYCLIEAYIRCSTEGVVLTFLYYWWVVGCYSITEGLPLCFKTILQDQPRFFQIGGTSDIVTYILNITLHLVISKLQITFNSVQNLFVFTIIYVFFKRSYFGHEKEQSFDNSGSL